MTAPETGRTPTLRVVLGMAGSGKSTLARGLAAQEGAVYLDKDTMTSRFVEAALISAGYHPSDRESNTYYREHLLPLEYESLLDVAGANLRLGLSVVVDAPFSPYLEDADFITEAARRLDWPAVDVEVLHVRVSPALLRRRLAERGLERDDGKLANWGEYWAQHGDRPCHWTGVRLLEIDNDSWDRTPRGGSRLSILRRVLDDPADMR